MRRLLLVQATVMLALALASGSAVAKGSVADAIARANQAWLAAYSAHDSAKLAALYASDAAALPPGAAMASGRAAIQKFWQGAMDAGITNVMLHTLDVTSSGSLAAETGQFSLDAPGKDGKLTTVSGKYVVVWKRVKGTWQLFRDIWNETPAH